MLTPLEGRIIGLNDVMSGWVYMPFATASTAFKN